MKNLQSTILAKKNRTSAALRIETPANKPTVPPIEESLVSKFALSSFSMLSKVGLAKKILIKRSVMLSLKPEKRTYMKCIKIILELHTL